MKMAVLVLFSLAAVGALYLAHDCYMTLTAERDDWRRVAKEAIQQRSSLDAQLRYSEISRKQWASDYQELKDSRDRLKANCKAPK